MGYRKLAGTPGSDGLNTCPTLIDAGTTDVTVIAQGTVLDEDTRRALNIPEGEDAVVMPKALILEAARRLTEDG